MVSDQLFFSVMISIIGITVSLVLVLIGILHGIHSKASSTSDGLSNIHGILTEILSPFRGIGALIQQKGIEGIVQDFMKFMRPNAIRKAEDPLPAEKAARRNQIIEEAKHRRLSEDEVRELRGILEEEARIQLAEGVIGFFGFLGILVLIGLFIAALIQPR